ncbi:AraC family transcriptional regulator [Prosthecochloris sp. SCSIO W1101]|uniref:helix-turn-helix transcriptional regulator n=1 Tax=Prosthecochloris sp. SCSIO W1101 TaxID=2992242 RepID=UPI00223E6479|nr:AraC family transcriptional regulator [Prosthecochloris sp. SCSIO W1101]UZJ40543.1 AraC family transcriptional regulator [Prosthecochloris sp. SCSIO W1101]
MDFRAHMPVNHIFSIGQAPLIFSFHMSGFGCARMTYSLTRRETVNGEPGKAIISFTPDSRCETETLLGQHYRVFNIYISPSHLYSQLGEELDIVPRAFRPALEGSGTFPYIRSSAMTVQTRVILDQIFNCPYQGRLRSMHLEYKSMELIIRQLYEAQGSEVKVRQSTLCPSDIERIREAERILTNDLKNPPTLEEMARQIGINTTKLKKGFREVFGTTAYALLREERLKRADRLLREDHMSITEIAHYLGFSDTSHFIREFSKHFGTTPGRFSRSYSR